MEEMEPLIFKSETPSEIKWMDAENQLSIEEEFQTIDSCSTNKTIANTLNKIKTEITIHRQTEKILIECEQVVDTTPTPVIENSLPEQKWRKGRPRKSNSSAIVEGSGESNVQNLSFSQRRSRRLSTYKDLAHDQCQPEANPKNTDAVLSCLETPSLANAKKPDEQRRGRGRPPGSKNKSFLDTSLLNETGRPRRSTNKTCLVHNVDEEKDDSSETNGEVNKQSRGRPKKKRNATTDPGISKTRQKLDKTYEGGNSSETSDSVIENNPEVANQKKAKNRPNTVITLSSESTAPIQIGNEQFSDNMDSSYNPDETTLSRKKSRKRRSRKTLNEEQDILNCAESLNEEHTNVTTPKRVKGRPRPIRNKINKKVKSLENPYYIPKKRLEESLAMLRDPNHLIWEENNTSCQSSIHRYYDDARMSGQTLQMKYARQCMLRRDWANLAKVLSLSLHEFRSVNFHPLFAKYGAICLAHADKQHFNKLVNHLLNVNDGPSVLKQCTQLRGNRHKE